MSLFRKSTFVGVQRNPEQEFNSASSENTRQVYAPNNDEDSVDDIIESDEEGELKDSDEGLAVLT